MTGHLHIELADMGVNAGWLLLVLVGMIDAWGPLSDRLAAQKARPVPAWKARGLPHEERLQPRHAVDKAEPEIADGSYRSKIVGNSRLSTSLVTPMRNVSKRRHCW